MKTKAIRATLGLAILLSLVISVYAAPNAPSTLSEGTAESRWFDTTDKTATAYGSNLTQLTITDDKQTQRWQGYFGNITGSITLDNANNWTMIDWSLGIIEGEVYAANESVSSWGTVHCINLSNIYPGNLCAWSNSDTSSPGGAGSGECLNVTEIEGSYGMGSSDSDGVNETFNGTLGSITVGTITASNCYMANMYVNDSSQSTYFWNETMLTVNNSQTVIYAAVVADDMYGYDNVTWDFQMIVGENGDIAGGMTYYFYVELS